MYNRSMQYNMNPAQRLEVLKKEMEHLAMEKEILQAQTRNLEMEREVAKLRQGILAVQSGNPPNTSEISVPLAPEQNEIVVTPRRIVKKTVSRSPAQPAFSPPRFIRRYEQPEERAPVLTPGARMVQASIQAKTTTQPKQQKVSTFMEKKQTSPNNSSLIGKRQISPTVSTFMKTREISSTNSAFMEKKQYSSISDIRYENTSPKTPVFNLHDTHLDYNENSSVTPPRKAQKRDLERYDDLSDTENNVNYFEIQQKSPSPVKPVKLSERKPEKLSTETKLTPAARQIKEDLEKKKAVKEAAERAKQEAKELKRKSDTTDGFSKVIKQTSAPPAETYTETAQSTHKPMDKQVPQTSTHIHKKQIETSLVETVKVKVTSPPKQISTPVLKSPRLNINEEEEPKRLTPAARAVQEIMEAKKDARTITPKTTPQPAKSPESSSRLNVTPSLPDTPKSRGVHFAKIERVHLNKPYTPDKVLTPEKVKGIIKPPRLTRRALHPEREAPKPRTSNRSSVYFNKKIVHDEIDSLEEDDDDDDTDTITQSSQVSESSTGSVTITRVTKTSSIASRGRKRQIDTESSNDDYSEIEEATATPQPTKRRKTYVTTPHPVKSRKRPSRTTATIADDDDDTNDDADISDASDVISTKSHLSKTSQLTGIKETEIQQKVKKSVKQTNSIESGEESEKNEASTSRNRRASLFTKSVTSEEKREDVDNVMSTPTKRRRSLPATKVSRGRQSEDSNEESEDSTLGTPSKRRRSAILPSTSSIKSKKMADIPEEKPEPKLTPAQRDLMAKLKDKDSGSKEKKSTVKIEKKIEENKPKLTPAARMVLAKMQEKSNLKKIPKEKDNLSSTGQSDSDLSDSSRRKSKRK